MGQRKLGAIEGELVSKPGLPVLVVPDSLAEMEGWSTTDLVEWLNSQALSHGRARLAVGLGLWAVRDRESEKFYSQLVAKLASLFDVEDGTLLRWRNAAQRHYELPDPTGAAARIAGQKKPQESSHIANGKQTSRSEGEEVPASRGNLPSDEGTSDEGAAPSELEQEQPDPPPETPAVVVPDGSAPDADSQGSSEDSGGAGLSGEAGLGTSGPDLGGSTVASPTGDSAARPSSVDQTPLVTRQRAVRLVESLSVEEIRECGLGAAERMATKVAAAAGGVFVLRAEFDKMRAAQRKVSEQETIIRELQTPAKPVHKRSVRPRDGRVPPTIGHQTSQVAAKDCAHPPNQRIGDHCMNCDTKVGK